MIPAGTRLFLPNGSGYSFGGKSQVLFGGKELGTQSWQEKWTWVPRKGVLLLVPYNCPFKHLKNKFSCILFGVLKVTYNKALPMITPWAYISLAIKQYVEKIELNHKALTRDTTIWYHNQLFSVQVSQNIFNESYACSIFKPKRQNIWFCTVIFEKCYFDKKSRTNNLTGVIFHGQMSL